MHTSPPRSPFALLLFGLVEIGCGDYGLEGTNRDLCYVDGDGDGFGADGGEAIDCPDDVEGGEVAFERGDCDDDDPAVNPDATEACNGVDDNCNDNTDEGSVTEFHLDADGDGFGDSNAALEGCDDHPPDGYVRDDSDCDDTASTVFPGGTEICNEVDDDCDSVVDEEAIDAASWYYDRDDDSYGDSANVEVACDIPSANHVEDGTDCDDSYADTHPGADEVCDDRDNDCDGESDEDASDASTWYYDADDDGLGDADNSTTACAQPANYLSDASDCNDGVVDVTPGDSCRILFYGPGELYEADYAEWLGYSIEVWDEATWRAAAEEDYWPFGAIVVGDGNGAISDDLQALYETRATWSVAIQGNIVVAGMDPSDHWAHNTTAAGSFLPNVLDWVVHGHGTGLYVATDEGERALDYLDQLGAFSSAPDDGNTITITDPSQPIFDGLTSADLSDWQMSVHSNITAYPAFCAPVATDADGDAVIVVGDAP